MAEMLLAHGFEKISGNFKHYNKKVVGQVVTGIVTTKKNYVQKIEVMNLLLLIMNMHMHRMMSHSIWLNCLVIVIELLGASNSKITA
jgi:hypothetical protein